MQTWTWTRPLLFGTAVIIAAAASCNPGGSDSTDLGSADMATSDDLAGGGGGGDGGSGGVTDMGHDPRADRSQPRTRPDDRQHRRHAHAAAASSPAATVTIDGQPATVKSVSPEPGRRQPCQPRPGVKGASHRRRHQPRRHGRSMSASIFGYYYGTIAFDPAAKTLRRWSALQRRGKPSWKTTSRSDLVATDNSPTGQLLVTLSGNGDGTFLPVAKYRCRQLRPTASRCSTWNADTVSTTCRRHQVRPASQLGQSRLLDQQQDRHLPKPHTPTPRATFPLSVDVQRRQRRRNPRPDRRQQRRRQQQLEPAARQVGRHF
jgi:hypothetical protein